MLRARPLAPLAAGFVTGIAASMALDAAIPLAGLAAISAALIIRWRHPVFILLLGAGLGGLRQEWAESRVPIPLSERIEGVVSGPPRIWRSMEDARADGTVRVGRVQVRFYAKEVPLIGGERVAVTGRMRRPRKATNPGQFDSAAYLKRRGVDAVMVMDDLKIIEPPPAPSRIRAWFRSLFDRGMRPEVAALESAIVLGRRGSVPDSLVLQLQRSGTAHLLAISGQHLALVTLTCWLLLTLAGVGGGTRSATLLVIIALYVLLTGMRVSVVRSFLMMAVYFGADFAWRRRDALSAMSAAALLLCIFDPAQVADAGFQLSFVAVLGLTFITPVFGGFTGEGGRPWNWFRGAMAVSLAAWLSTAPIVQSHFNLMTPGIILGNLLLVPLISLELLIGMAHLALAPLGAGALSGFAAGLVFDAIDLVSRAVVSIPYAYLYTPAPPPLLIVAYAAALWAWTWACRRKGTRAWKIACVALIVIPLGLTGPLLHRAPEGLFLAVLDVGRGSCAYLERPDGRNVMVDCGSMNARDPGESIASRYLWQRGVTRLDTLVLSHADADHVNGARSVIDLMHVRRVIIPRGFPQWEFPDGVEVIRVERVAEPLRLGDLEILAPPVWEKFGGPVPTNETSIVLRTGGVLIPGDVQERGVEELLTLPDLRARVLVMPHHGKFFDQHEEFVRRVTPETIIVSATEGYYSTRVIGALPIEPLITGRQGAIEMIVPE